MLITMLYQKGFAREEIVNIGRFLDGIFVMLKPKGLEYNQFVSNIEKEKNVSYLTSFEELGIEKGEKNLFARLLNLKFQNLPDIYKTKIELQKQKN